MRSIIFYTNTLYTHFSLIIQVQMKEVIVFTTYGQGKTVRL